MMNNLKAIFGRGVSLLLLAVCTGLLAGCETLDAGNGSVTNPPPVAPPHHSERGTETLNVGDAVEVTFSDLPLQLPPFKEQVKPDGSVTLLYGQKFQFAGKNRGDLEAEIRERYVPAYFNNLTVTIQTGNRFFYVTGEVKLPGRYPIAGDVTVLKAITSAAGFTDFAAKRRVRLVRTTGQTFTQDCIDSVGNPRLDLPVYSGDQVVVDRSAW